MLTQFIIFALIAIVLYQAMKATLIASAGLIRARNAKSNAARYEKEIRRGR